VGLFGKQSLIEREPVGSTLLMAMKSIAFYLQKFLLPTNLSVFYPFHGPISIASADFFLPVLVVIAVTVAVFLSMRWTKWIAFAWGFFLLTVLPSFINYDKGDLYIGSDRYMYLPSVGLFALLGVAVARLIASKTSGFLRKRTIMVAVPVVAISVSFAWIAQAHALRFRNFYTLFEYTIAAYPSTRFAHAQLGEKYLDDGRIDDALRELRAALVITPRAGVLCDLGDAYLAQGSKERAREAYQLALEGFPKSGKAFVRLGDLAAAEGNNEQAIDFYSQAIERGIQEPDLYLGRGQLFASQGKLDEAIADLRETTRLEPDRIEAHYNLAVAYLKKNDDRNAFAEFQTLTVIRPDFTSAYLQLGLILANRGDLDGARKQFSDVLRMDPENAMAKDALEKLR
jgi:tetratricopeptide (TPR) repeat protein